MVEILSSDPARDIIRKAAKYAAAGVSRYWIIDPDGPEVVVYELGDGSLRRARPSPVGHHRSPSTSVRPPSHSIRATWCERRSSPPTQSSHGLSSTSHSSIDSICGKPR